MASPPQLSVSCQQTRFSIAVSDVFSGIDVKSLSITILPSTDSSSALAPATARKVKGKAKAGAAGGEGIEILTGTDLKLNPGSRYALVGRNGSGKSTLLRALAQKLIPGIPTSTRIAILQQTTTSTKPNPPDKPEQAKSSEKPSSLTSSLASAHLTPPAPSPDPPQDRHLLTPLQRILSADSSFTLVQHEAALLSKAIETYNPPEEGPINVIRTLRRIRLDRLRRELAEAEQNARLRSGARGAAARKEVIILEKRVVEAEGLLTAVNPKIGGDGSVRLDSEAVEAEIQEAIALWSELQTTLQNRESQNSRQKRASSILSGLGFTETMLKKPFRDLSGGWQMRCLLAETLFQDCDVMILDEPTNFLDLLGIVWLQRFLSDEGSKGEADAKRVAVVVSHDRDFVDTVCDETLVLRDRTIVPFAGTPSAYEDDLRGRILHMGRMKEAQDRQVKAAEKGIASDLRDAKARGNDNKIRAAKVRQKRLDERTGMQVSATGGRFKLNRDRMGFHDSLRDEIEVPTEERGMGGVFFPEASKLKFPGSLVSLENTSWRYKSSLPLVLQGVSLVIHKGDRIGVVGLNGSGKSTLIKLLVEETRKPTAGKIERHPQLRLGYYSQHAVENLQAMSEPGLTALSLMMREVDGAISEGDLRGLLGRLGLPGRTASDTPIDKLSGGQLVRLAMARIMWNSPNLLVLDEISTHLDHYTVSALVDALRDYDGAVVLVSHDRFLVRSVIEEEDEDEDDGIGKGKSGEAPRRRIVYLMRKGELKKLAAGVGGFEASLQKRLQQI